MAAEYPGTATPTIPIPVAGPGVFLNNPPLTGVLADIAGELLAVTGTLGANPQGLSATVKGRLDALDTTITGLASASSVTAINTLLGTTPQGAYSTVGARLDGIEAAATTTLAVVSDGVTDAAPAIQAVLDALPASTRPLRVLVVGTTKGTIYLNSKVRITTSNTTVSFAAPVLIGTGIDPDGFGGLSVLGTAFTQTTVTSGATRGSSKVVVASATGLTTKMLMRIYDADTTGGASAGHKSEMVEIVDISGTTIYLDHPLHHTYTGTVTFDRIAPVVNSGFDGVNATFTGQQAAGFLFPVKIQYGSRCFLRNMHFRGDPSNSWARECFNFRWSYRSYAANCGASFGWDYAVGSTYDYGFTSDGSTGIDYTNCYAVNVRHGFSADKGSAGVKYTGCTVENATASAFDLHGGWVRDIVYTGCYATASDTRNSNDATKVGFLAGNTTFTNGAQYITYVGCVARNYSSYTANGGAANAGEGIGFQVVDGCSDIVIQACRVIDSMFGVKVLSQFGVPINRVTVLGSEFDNINPGSGTAGVPVYITAGIAPGDVNEFVFKNNVFNNCANQAAMRLYGTAGNTLTNIIVEGNLWRGAGVAGVYAMDLRFLDNLLVTRNTLQRTRRGVQIRGCVGAEIVGNVFDNLVDGTDASRIIFDDTNVGANPNTNFVFRNNDIFGTATTWGGRDISSSGASVDVMPVQRLYTTAARPSAVIVKAGCQYYDTTLSKPGWSDGTVWRDAAGTAI